MSEHRHKYEWKSPHGHFSWDYSHGRPQPDEHKKKELFTAEEQADTQTGFFTHLFHYLEDLSFGGSALSRHNRYKWKFPYGMNYNWNGPFRHSRRGLFRKGKQLSPEEQALHEARKRANEKIGFIAHLVPYLAVCTLLLIVAGFWVAAIVALMWGIGLAMHGFGAFIAPELRQHWIEQEVGRQVNAGVVHERRTMESKHVRSMEDLSASIAHEIRNPITAAKSLVQQMGEDPVARENVEYAKVALDELDRVERSISNLLRYARDEEMCLEVVFIEDVIASALETFRDRIGRLEVEVKQDISNTGAILGDLEKLRRVLINLINNALDAFEGNGTKQPCLEISAGENLAGTDVWIRLRDNGSGIDPEVLDKIFNPFYTSKEDGTGLGLALSRKIIDAHGGSIEVASKPGKGTEFVLAFPKQTEDPEKDNE